MSAPGDGLREFAMEVAESLDGEGTVVYRYRLTMSRGTDGGTVLTEWESPWETLQAQTLAGARLEARDRAVLVVALIQGVKVESLEPEPLRCTCREVTLPDGHGVLLARPGGGGVEHHEPATACWLEPHRRVRDSPQA